MLVDTGADGLGPNTGRLRRNLKTEGIEPENIYTVILTRRDILLLNLCLQVVERDYTKDGTLHSDIQSLREKLSYETGEGK